MASKLSDKIIHGLKNSRFLRSAELKEFDNLIKGIGECKSKAEEDRIIVQELETLKVRLSDPKLDKQRGREYMVRCIYCEMLGHDASFAYVKALQFASETNVHTKKAAYLALTQFLDYSNELILLLVNTLLSDLKSDNFIIVGSALVVCTKLIGPDLINAVYPVVIERLSHPKENVRKKAIMVLQRFHQLDPTREGPLAGVDLDRHFRTMLCDKDPSVMSAALCALHEVIRSDPKSFKNLIPSFTSILKQVSEHRLPKTYDYHRYPAPFIQIKLLKIMSLLGAGDRFASENMYTVLQQALKRTSNSHTIGSALIAEYVRTITSIYPNPSLLAAAAEAIALFLKSSSHNLRYVGIDALACIVKINPQHAQDHQLTVIDCLEDPDDTLKLKTLELLYKMTKANNVEVIVEKMMSYLRGATDEHIRRDIARKVSELAERYAPSPKWFIAIVSEVFELGGEHVEPQIAHNLMHLIAEQDQELHVSAVEVYMRLLDKPKLPPILQEVICWVLGEYGALAESSTMLRASPQDVMSRLAKLYESQRATDGVRALVITALSKIVAQTSLRLGPEIEVLLHKASCSQNLELQQRAYELQAIAASQQALQMSVLPADASCEDFEDHELQQLPRLSFLDAYVADALRKGAAPYIPSEQRDNGGHAAANGSRGHLRFEAYETAPAPVVSINGHSRTPSYSSFSTQQAHGNGDMLGVSGSAASSSTQNGGEPTLRATAGPASSAVAQHRWGPAEFASSRPPPASGAAGPPGPPPAVDFLGGAMSSSFSARPVVANPERDRLAASIFGGGGGSAAAKTPQATAPGTPPRPPAGGTGVMDLLDFGSPSPMHAQQHQQQMQARAWAGGGGGIDLLGFDAAPTASANMGMPQMYAQGQDDLMGGLGGGFPGMGATQAMTQQQGGLPYGMPPQGQQQQFPPQQQQQQQHFPPQQQQQYQQHSFPGQMQQQQFPPQRGLGAGGGSIVGGPGMMGVVAPGMMGGVQPVHSTHTAAMRPSQQTRPATNPDPFADLLG